jgi:hypothetical protein
MLATHRALCAILSPSRLTCSSAGPAFPARSTALASMIQVTTEKTACASFTCTLYAIIIEGYFRVQWTLELRMVWCSNNLKLEQKIRGKSGFETQTKNRKSNKESRGRLLSLLGPDERRVIHLPVNNNIPPTITIDWLLYNIFYVCTIINKNFQLLKLNILVLSLWSFEIGT